MIISQEVTIDGASYYMEAKNLTFDPIGCTVTLQKIAPDRRSWHPIDPDAALAPIVKGFHIGVITMLQHYQDAPGWEMIARDTTNAGATFRLAVPGGWLYRIDHYQTPSCTFVPDPRIATWGNARAIKQDIEISLPEGFEK